MNQQHLINPYFYYLGESLRRLDTLKDIDDHQNSRNQQLIGYHQSSAEHQLSNIKQDFEQRKNNERLCQIMDATKKVLRELDQIEMIFSRIKSSSESQQMESEQF